MISCMQFNEWMLIVFLKQRWISVLDMHAVERLEKALRNCLLTKLAWGWDVCNIGILCWNDITVIPCIMVTRFIWSPHYYRQGTFQFWNFGKKSKLNRPFWFGPTGIFGTTFEGGPLWLVQLSLLVGLKCPFSFDIIVVSSSTLLHPAYENNNQTHLGLGWVCATGRYCSIEQVEFVKFQSGINIEWQAPTICFVPG